MMMMLSNSRVLVNGTTVSSVAKKSTAKVLLTLSSSFSLSFSLLLFVYSTAFNIFKRDVMEDNFPLFSILMIEEQ